MIAWLITCLAALSGQTCLHGHRVQLEKVIKYSCMRNIQLPRNSPSWEGHRDTTRSTRREDVEQILNPVVIEVSQGNGLLLPRFEHVGRLNWHVMLPAIFFLQCLCQIYPHKCDAQKPQHTSCISSCSLFQRKQKSVALWTFTYVPGAVSPSYLYFLLA